MTKQREIWRFVPSQKGVMASSFGRILLPPRYAPLPNGGYRFYETKPILGVVRKSKKNAKHSYYGTWMRERGNMKIHQLVCEAFHGEKPFPNAVVMHLDENGLNNRPENLKWGTQKENLNAKGFIEYCKSRTGENSSSYKGKQAKLDQAGLML